MFRQSGVFALFTLVSLAFLTPASAQPLTPPPLFTPPTGAQPFDFYRRMPYRSEVPRPSTILGYEVGERHSTYREQERVVLAITQAAPDRTRVVEYGKSVEGRPLRLIFVSSPENIARLDAIREDIGKLADPRRLSTPADADTIIHSSPVLTWINHTIHGDESASFETAMWTLYTLVASDAPEVRDALRKSVVVLNPVFNPDGHERFVVWYNSVAIGTPEQGAYELSQPWAVRGRYNHYRFDMNRDKLTQSQQETRQETAAYLRWNPQVFVDQHGQPNTYFFPPNAPASNANVDRARVDRWTDLIGRANARTFDSYGWAYINRETFDFFAPVYLDSFTTLNGAIGMTYETDGGGNLARYRDDGTISTLRDAAAHHFETAMTTVLTAAANRENLLRDFYIFRKTALEGTGEKLRRVVILPGRDPGRVAEFASLMTRVGIEVREVTAPFESGKAHDYSAPAKAGAKRQKFPVGALVVDLAQPQGHLARAFLEPDAEFDPGFVEQQLARRERNERKNERESTEGYDFYDITAWSLPMAFGLESYWTEDAEPVMGSVLAPGTDGNVHITTQGGGVKGGRADVAYLFRFNRDNAAVLALRLQQEGFRLQTVTKPITIGKEEWPRGTLIARVDRNPDTLHQRIATLAEELGVPIQAFGSTYAESSVGIGSENNVVSLRRPRIAVLADDNVSVDSYGAVWYLLDTLGIRFTPVRLGSLRGRSLDRFNVVILPDGFSYSARIGKPGIQDLKEWIERGGALLGLGDGGVWFSEKDVDLTSARPVDGEKGKQPQYLPGAIFAAKVATDHFLGYGYPEGEILVPLSGSTFLTASKTGTNAVTFNKKGPNTRSGFVWPGNTEELLAGTSYAIDEPYGSGHALLYLSDPTFRAYYPSLRRLFLAGILYGPGGGL